MRVIPLLHRYSNLLPTRTLFPKQRIKYPHRFATVVEGINGGLDEKHDFQIERQYKMIWGQKGSLPSEQYQYRETTPIVVCKNCKKRIETKVVQGPIPEDEVTFRQAEWNNQYMVPSNPVVLEESCGEVVHFVVREANRFSIQRAILEERHPDSLLTRSVLDAWTKKPYDDVVIDGDPAYFGLILDFVRDGTATLPAGILKDIFLNDLAAYGISYDKEAVAVDLSPAVMAAGVVAMKKHLAGFQSRIIEGDLQEQMKTLQGKLDCARFVHFVMTRFYEKEHEFIVRLEIGDLPADLQKKDFSGTQALSCCNTYFELFGLRAEYQEGTYSLGLNIRFSILEQT